MLITDWVCLFPHVELDPIKFAVEALTSLSIASAAFVESPTVMPMLMLMRML